MKRPRQIPSLHLALDDVLRAARMPSIEEFAREHIMVQTGPWAGRPFQPEKSPIARHFWPVLFDEDLTRYEHYSITGPSQSGKTLSAVIIPIVYTLFCLQESVILASPLMEIAGSKFSEEIWPMLKSDPALSALLLARENQTPPRMSHTMRTYHFRNATHLRIISTQSADKGKASFTTRNVYITEFGGARPVSTSEEADPIRQLIARTRAFTKVGTRFVMESTGSIEGGLVDRQVRAGTRGEICAPCPNCEEWISPWRRHFVLNRENPSASTVICPQCGFAIDEHMRQGMLRNTKLILANPDAPAFSMAMSGFFNQFTTLPLIAREEAELLHLGGAQRANKLRELSNFVWGEIYIPEDDALDLRLTDVSSVGDTLHARGVVPDWADHLTLGIDLHLRGHFWVLAAWGREHGRLRGHVVDYGFAATREEEDKHLKSRDVIMIEALNALMAFHSGVTYRLPIGLTLVDIGYMFDSLLIYCGQKSREWRILGAKGSGGRQGTGRRAATLATRHVQVLQEGEDYQICLRRADRHRIAFVRHEVANERYYIQQMRRSEDLTLFASPDPKEHEEFSSHLDSHFQIANEHGEIVWQVRVGHPDHWLDAMILSATAWKILDKSVSFAAMAANAEGNGVNSRPAEKTVDSGKKGAIMRSTRGPVRILRQPRRIFRA